MMAEPLRITPPVPLLDLKAQYATIREEVRRSRAVPMMLIITLEDRAGGRLCSPPSLRVRSRKQRQ